MHALRWLALAMLVWSGCRCQPVVAPTGSDVRIEPRQLEFGGVYVGTTKSRAVQLTNGGRAPVSITLAATAPFSVEASLELAGGAALEVPVTFAPLAAGPNAGTLTLDDGITTTQVELIADALPIPVCEAGACTTATFSTELGTCVTTARVDGTGCDPGCGASGLCVGGVCLAQNAGNCDDGNPCTNDACGANGQCVTSPRSCPVTSGCRSASCDPAVGCIETPITDGTACAEATCRDSFLCIDGECATRRNVDADTRCTYTDVGVHSFSVCALSLSGDTRCWGSNLANRLLRDGGSSFALPDLWAVGFPVRGFLGGRERLCAHDGLGNIACPPTRPLSPGLDVNGPSSVTADGGIVNATASNFQTELSARLPARRIWTFLGTACAQFATGEVGCWGNSNDFSDVVPASVRFEVMPFSSPPTEVATARGTCGLMSDGGLECFGSSTSTGALAQRPLQTGAWQTFFSGTVVYGHRSDGEVDACSTELDANGVLSRPCRPMPDGRRYTRLSGDGNTTCGVTDGGALWCWGSNVYGQLGVPTFYTVASTVPVSDVRFHDRGFTVFGDGGVFDAQGSPLSLPPGTVERACSPDVVIDGATWVFSNGVFSMSSGAPTLQPSFADCLALDAGVRGEVRFSTQGTDVSCRLEHDGGIQCSGLTDGTLGFGARDAGLQQADQHLAIPPAREVRNTYNAGCALTESGHVWCWGDPFEKPVPQLVPSLPFPTRQLECGNEHCCALHGENSVRCWGANYDSALGTPGPATVVPKPVVIDERVRALTPQATCALYESGRLRCWGYGWLRRDVPRVSATPVLIER